MKLNKANFNLFLVIFSLYLLSIYFHLIRDKNKLSKKNDYFKVANIFVAKIDQDLNLRNIAPHDKWIIVTSVNEPTEQCIKLSKIDGFKLVVVGDLKTNQNWKLENTIFLSINAQENLNFKSFQTTLFNSYTRKNIGYLFAIKNGAKFIYDTDDDNAPTVDIMKYFNYKPTDYGLIYDCKNTNNILNPYAHFGQPMIWPRGYPLTEIQFNYNNSYISGLRKTSIVQQGVVNGDPDVDAIFRLTKTMNYKKIDIKFDNSSPSFQIPLYKMSPYNSQNTLISYNGFWSLYLPKTVSFRLTDIWRSYWSQRLMWLINETVTFNGPNAYQLRNSHSYLKDFEQEKEMYLQTEKFVKFLYDWKCTSDKFYSCMIQLTKEMADKKFWELDEVESVKNWIEDLKTIGYKEPDIVNFEYENKKMNCSYTLDWNQYSRVRYTPKFQKTLDSDNYCCDGKQINLYDNLEIFNYFKKHCNRLNVSLEYPEKYIETESQFESKVNYSLLITFNNVAITENIIALKLLYSGYFQNIIFCGDKMTTFFLNNSGLFKKFDSYTFLEFNTWNGGLHYYCMAKAIEMNFNTEGFLLMSDDVFLKYWNLKLLNPNKIWFPIVLDLVYELRLGERPMWLHWNGAVITIGKVLDHFNKVLNGTIKAESSEIEIIKSYLNNIELNQDSKGNLTKIVYFGSDTFYLPRNKFVKFHYIVRIFRLYLVYLEAAVPNILAGLDLKKSIDLFQGEYTWVGAQFNFDNYNKLVHFYHPFKFSKLNVTYPGVPFCKVYLKDKFLN